MIWAFLLKTNLFFVSLALGKKYFLPSRLRETKHANEVYRAEINTYLSLMWVDFEPRWLREETQYNVSMNERWAPFPTDPLHAVASWCFFALVAYWRPQLNLRSPAGQELETSKFSYVYEFIIWFKLPHIAKPAICKNKKYKSCPKQCPHAEKITFSFTRSLALSRLETRNRWVNPIRSPSEKSLMCNE